MLFSEICEFLEQFDSIDSDDLIASLILYISHEN
jgi:hypothetical protein